MRSETSHPPATTAEQDPPAALWDRPLNIRSVALTGILLLMLAYTLSAAASLLIPIFLAWLGNMLLTPPTRALNRLHIPLPLAAAMTLAVLLALLVAAILALSAPASEWIHNAPAVMKEVEHKFRPISSSLKQLKDTKEKIESEVSGMDDNPKSNVVQTETKQPGFITQFLVGTPDALASFGIFFVLLYFLLAAGDVFLLKLVRITPRLRDKKRAVTIMREIQQETSSYLFTVTVINVTLGTVAALVLWALGMPNPVLWGVMVGVLNFAPYIGPLVSLSILAMVAVISFDTIVDAIWVPVVIGLLNILEGQFITPHVVGRRLSLNTVLVFLSIVFWGWLWGIAGVLIAVPLLASLKVICEKIEPLNPISELLEG